MSLLIQQPGILTTIQDLGRFGYRRFGINTNGAMDRQAVMLINCLLGNDENEAVLEMHFPAARILFEQPCVFAIGGADLSPILDGEPVVNWRPFQAETGSDLRFAAKSCGNRSYLAISGGLAADQWLGSSSTNMLAGVGGMKGRKLAAGDRVHLRPTSSVCTAVPASLSRTMVPSYSNFPTIRVTPGAEFGGLTEESRVKLFSDPYVMSNGSDRMGFRLIGRPLSLKNYIEMLSSAVCMGTVQLLPDGQMIILMADHQTTGGYPRIARITERDLSVLAQLGGGDKVAFSLMEPDESEKLNAEFERKMALLKAGCQLNIHN